MNASKSIPLPIVVDQPIPQITQHSTLFQGAAVSSYSLSGPSTQASDWSRPQDALPIMPPDADDNGRKSGQQYNSLLTPKHQLPSFSDIEPVLYEESSFVAWSAALLSSTRNLFSSLSFSSSGGVILRRRFLTQGLADVTIPVCCLTTAALSSACSRNEHRVLAEITIGSRSLPSGSARASVAKSRRRSWRPPVRDVFGLPLLSRKTCSK